MVASISRDDNDDDDDNDDSSGNGGDDDDDDDDDMATMTRQRSAGTTRKRNQKNPGNTTDSNDNGNANDNASSVHTTKQTPIALDGDILLSSSLPPTMSYPQAATDMRFWSKEGCVGGCSGGAVSETASYVNANN